MRARHFLRKLKEATGDGDVANAVIAEVIKLIGEGHTEVSPDVITTKVSAALGRPFMLKDLVAANNSSPELQHYIDTINPSKIKFSTDILTVKNQDPMKEKQAAQDGVSKMASRAAGRPRLGESIVNEATRDEKWQGWVIRYETKPQFEGQPVRWMTWNEKRGTESAHEGQAMSPEQAIEAAKQWIQSGGNAKEINTSKNLTIDFNAKFVSDILNGGKEFFAKIEQGPVLIISDNMLAGFNRTYLGRSKKDQQLQLPSMTLSGKQAAEAGLRANGRYILGDTRKRKDGTLLFPLIYQSTVQSRSDKVHMSKPGITIAAPREASGLEETNSGISKSAETKFHKKLDKLVHATFGQRKEEMKEESSSIKGPHGYMDVERKNGVTTVKRREWDSSSEKRTNVKGGTWFPKSNRHGEGEGTSVKTGSGVSSNFGTRRKSPAYDLDDYTERERDIYENYRNYYGHDRVQLPDEPSLYWSNAGRLSNEYNELYNKLVPSSGKADTIEGEVLRAASKIYYRHYNDGDSFNQASFDQLEPYIGTVKSYDDLAEKATEFALKANGQYTPNPDWDSLDAMEYGPEDESDDEDDWYRDEEDYEDDSNWEDDDDLEEDSKPKATPAKTSGINWPKEVPSDRELERAANRDEEENDPHPYVDPDELREDDYEDDYEEDQGFFVAISSEEDGVFIGMLVKEDGKWRERTYKGKAPYNWGGTYMGYLTPQDVMSWINKDYGRSYEVQGPMDEDEANEYLDYMNEGIVDKVRGANYKRLAKRSFDKAYDAHQDSIDAPKTPAERRSARAEFNKQYDKGVAREKLAKELGEGWESGPEERAPRERDPDYEYDVRRQEKLDRAAAAEPKKTTYKLLGRGPKGEPNYGFGLDEFDTQEEAVAARDRLMVDPNTPNPRDISIQTIRRSVAEGVDIIRKLAGLK